MIRTLAILTPLFVAPLALSAAPLDPSHAPVAAQATSPSQSAASSSPPTAGADANRAFLGLTVRDIAGVGCVITWIDPGPLDGRGLDSPSLGRPDLLVTVDGVPANAASLEAAVRAKSPGDTLRLTYRRAATRGPSLPTPGSVTHDASEQQLTVELAARSTWTGTYGSPGLPAHDAPLPSPALLKHAAVERALAADTELSGRLAALIAAQRAVCEREPDARRLSRVTAALTEPLALPELAAAIAAPTTQGLRPARLAAVLTAEELDATPPTGETHGSVPVPGSQSGIYALDFFASEARLHMQEALGEHYANDAVARAAIATARGMRDSLLIAGPEARDRFASIQRGATIDMHAIVAAVAHLDADLAIAPDVAQGEVEGIPDELKDAVTGTVLTAQPIPDIGWAVVGGAGANTYDMSKIAAVLDLGGNDLYTMSDLAIGMRVIVDVTGDDEYRGGRDQGIACGLCGLFLVDDQAGNDRYIGQAFNAGAACFGAGLLIDRGGDDHYEGTEWSLGAACWGTGILLDLGGSDSYRSEFLSQGCGGPRGFGAIVDRGGDDLYDAIGRQPSQYGTPATIASFSQGVGIGIRRAAAGGIGMIADLGGNDRYLAGEFSQGGGYFYGLGLLHDAGGNDRYWADRYGQAWAAHQASGILVDGGGDDTYVARTAANQGAAWDQSTALLYDASGNDSYQADSLAQGSAAEQALAFLIDGGGSDRYIAVGEIAQGHSGSNDYHFEQEAPIGGVFSFSLFLDLIGGGTENDLFSTGRAAGQSIRLGTRDAARPANSTVDGLFIDVVK